MIFELLFVILLGIIAGSITGLMPGLHINLVGLALIIFSPFLLQFFSPLALAIFIVSMTITHTFTDFVPSIFLGAPDDDTALSVLPGHKLLLKGYGYAAVKITLTGLFLGLLVTLLITPGFILILPKIYPIIKNYMAFILISFSAFLILTEKNKFWAFFLFMLSGVLGIASLNLAIIKQPLFPLLSGLFGISLLSLSCFKNVKIPKQKIKEIVISKKETFKAMIASIFSGTLCCFLPGLGASQAAVIGSSFFKKIKQETFLILLGAINIIVMAMSFVTLYSIERARTGSAVFVGKLLENFNGYYLFITLGVIFITGCISYFLTDIYAKFFARNITKVKYNYLCMFVILLVIIMCILVSGWLSLLILLTGTCLGILSTIKGVKKMFLMGCLMVPVIMYYI